MAFSARKPYLNLKKSITEFFSAPARFLKPSGQKESQFEKPYQTGEYQTMHQDLPNPDWPTWEFGPPIVSGHFGGFGNFGKFPKSSISPVVRKRDQKRYFSAYGPVDMNKGGVCPGCALYIDSNFGKCENPIEVHAGIFCTFDPPKGSDCDLRILSESSSQVVTTGAYWSMGPSKAVWLDPNVAEHIIIAEMIDGAGNTCHAALTQECADICPAVETFLFDDASTPDTIVAGSYIDVYISGGSTPFVYTVSGTGYTWDRSDTSTLNSYRRKERLDCASGACGVDYAPTATISILDLCETEVGSTIKNTAGELGYADCGYYSESGTYDYLGKTYSYTFQLCESGSEASDLADAHQAAAGENAAGISFQAASCPWTMEDFILFDYCCYASYNSYIKTGETTYNVVFFAYVVNECDWVCP